MVGCVPFFLVFFGGVYFRMYGSPFATAKMVLLSVAVTALLGAASLLLVVLPMLSVGGEGLTLFFGLAYPIGDLALLLPAFLSLLVYWAYKLGKAYVVSR